LQASERHIFDVMRNFSIIFFFAEI
jgi:hypothetical protein